MNIAYIGYFLMAGCVAAVIFAVVALFGRKGAGAEAIIFDDNGDALSDAISK